MKHTAVSQLIPNPSIRKSTATNIIRILYSANKNAFAPSAIAPAISFILSFPASLLFIMPVLIKAKITAMTPAIGARKINLFMLLLLSIPVTFLQTIICSNIVFMCFEFVKIITNFVVLILYHFKLFYSTLFSKK